MYFISKRITEGDGQDSPNTRLRRSMICSNSYLLSWLMFWIFFQGCLGLAHTLGGAMSAVDGFLNLDKQTGRVVNVTSPHSVFKLKQKTLYGFTFEMRFAPEPNYYILLLNLVFTFQHFNYIFHHIWWTMYNKCFQCSDIRNARSLILVNNFFKKWGSGRKCDLSKK